jgi:hypothetical protein
MPQRPTSLTIIGWFVLVMAGFGLVAQITARNNPMAQQMLAQSPLPAWVHLLVGVAGIIVSAACGYGILKGLNWSRLLYIGWSLFSLVFGLLTVPFTSIALLGLLFVGVMAFFLFRPVANAWFTGAAAAPGQ